MPSIDRAGLFAPRPLIYTLVVLVAVLAGLTYQVRSRTIFACKADGYNADQYIAYCNASGYADYEHGAFWFDLEPAAKDFAKKADVVFLGNSRMQVAFSAEATGNWFSAIPTRYYLLGFSYGENVVMTEELLRRLQPRAKVYVINVDDFFERIETAPMKTILHEADARDRYETKRRWQHIHERICTKLSALCRSDYVIFRSRETGAYTKKTDRDQITPVSDDWAVDQNLVKSSTSIAKGFLAKLAVPRECVILTMVPTVGTRIGNVTAIAEALGVPLMTPELSQGLLTFDGSHLDKASAERWSQAFFQMANSKIRSCL
jgi:hypothetical protein